MRHLIMGTAGHVDHGKTTLIKALTGIDCDTHPEEKRRGITINLGFAHLKLPSGDTIGIIDVPGHKDFIHTMVSGASGIDFVCLVVAADSGIMPQTREHLQIMEMLGISKGIVAVTRIDCADDDLTAMACEELREFTSGTFLRDCPICFVSARTGQGMEELKAAIYNLANGIEERPVGSIFRMFIDRVFTVKGFGTVATGSVLSGTLRRDRKAYMLPDGKEARVRGLQRHGAPVELVTAGDRASVNMAGFNKSEFRPGMMIAGGLFASTRLIDVRLRLFDDARQINVWSETIFICGTYEAQARIHLLDANSLAAGQSALAQITLPRPLPALYGDRFILRDTSGDRTLGGGAVIDAAPRFHRRRPAPLIRDIRNRADGGLAGAVAAEISKRKAPVPAGDIEELFNISGNELRAALCDEAATDGILYDERDKTRVLLSKQTADALPEEIRSILAAHHDRNPLSEEGCGAESLCAMLRLDQRLRPYIAARLDEMASAGALKKINGTFALPDRRGQITPLLQKQIDFVEECFRSYGERTPSMAEIRAGSAGQGIDASLFQWITNRLAEQKKICPTSDTYLHIDTVNAFRPRLFSMLRDHPEGVTVAQFRDAVSAGRDFCVLLCDYFNRVGVTLRKGNVHVLTDKGKEAAAISSLPANPPHSHDTSHAELHPPAPPA